jgi:putative LysE/RhtB family amino acid efflux pump
MEPFLVGFGLGFVVALQLGPMSLFLIRSTLRRGWLVGIAIGVGIAVVDGLYAAAGAAGAAPILAIDPIQLVLGLLGAAVLVALGVRTLWSAFRIRLGGEDESEVAGPRRAFVTAVAATASNPLTIASWAAIFSAASAAGNADSASAAVLLIFGVGLGSATWDTGLASGTALVGRAAGRRLLVAVDVIAGAGMLAFGGVLAYRTLQEG